MSSLLSKFAAWLRRCFARLRRGTAEPGGDADGGRFLAGRHRHGRLNKRYRLYLPAGDAAGRPLLVMLHGCLQQPEDFARGSRMNAHAARLGIAVLYPAQRRRANAQQCWNWFSPRHQRRDAGEPGFIASLAEEVIAAHGLDRQRVFVAGMSAGGAMAALMGAEYPDLFAAVGIHSGLAPRAAIGVTQALYVMRHGGSSWIGRRTPLPQPTIVFHGDADTTVHPRNGEAAVDACLSAREARLVGDHEGHCALGRRYLRRCWHDDEDRPLAEHWLVHGAGHAWSGGDPAGNWTDAHGPDASAEMLRFFLGAG